MQFIQKKNRRVLNPVKTFNFHTTTTTTSNEKEEESMVVNKEKEIISAPKKEKKVTTSKINENVEKNNLIEE